MFGEEREISLTILTQVDGSSVIKEMIRKKIIKDWKNTVLFDDLDDTELEHTSYGAKIRKATYLTEEELMSHLEKLE